MKTFICEICGDAHLGSEKPKNCPFCGAREAFIKDGNDADPVINNEQKLTDVTVANLKETLRLEQDAVAIYRCMADKADSYEIKAMYKRLASVEQEHISIVCKLLKIEKPKPLTETCSDEMAENFKRTIELEENATNLYFKFAKEATENKLKIMFTGIAQAEEDHIKLINNYL